jgi:hypothetical protein
LATLQALLELQTRVVVVVLAHKIMVVVLELLSKVKQAVQA